MRVTAVAAAILHLSTSENSPDVEFDDNPSQPAESATLPTIKLTTANVPKISNI